MSAFVVEKSTIDAIVTYVMTAAKQGEISHLQYAIPGFEIPTNAQRFGQALLNMNIEAVDQRYKEMSDRETYHYNPRLEDLVVVYKAMECLIYQCSEGDVPESVLYQALERIKNELGSRIISGLPEYEEAVWR
jgi:hypothetical protein